jgi:hypothetical protein
MQHNYIEIAATTIRFIYSNQLKYETIKNINPSVMIYKTLTRCNKDYAIYYIALNNFNKGLKGL